MAPSESSLRWSLAGTEQQGSLLDDEVDPTRELREVEYLHVRARSIISEVPRASRMPFRYTINPYRGCSHACTYCFARPTHEYLGLNGLEDFERRIVVKINAVQRLAAELARPSWGGEHIAMGTNTDPYQQAEGRYKLTRGILETLTEARNPFSVLTKSTMILRDIDVFEAAAARTEVKANLSIGTLDEDVWHTSEPGTPPPLRRVEAVARLNEAGVPCGVLIAPILPGISDGDEQLSAVVRACVEAGAVSISSIGLHLRPGVRELFMPWLERVRPDLVERYETLYGARSGYLAREEQERISARVRALVQKFGGCARSPRRRAWRSSRSPAGTRRSRRTSSCRSSADGIVVRTSHPRRTYAGHGATGMRRRSGSLACSALSVALCAVAAGRRRRPLDFVTAPAGVKRACAATAKFVGYAVPCPLEVPRGLFGESGGGGCAGGVVFAPFRSAATCEGARGWRGWVAA